MMIMTIITCLMIGINTVDGNQNSGEIVNRINLGLIFHYVEDVSPVSNDWNFIFRVILPPKDIVNEFTKDNDEKACNAGNIGKPTTVWFHNGTSMNVISPRMLCDRFKREIDLLIRVESNAKRRLQDLVEDIYSIITREENSQRHDKRSLIPIGGSFLRGLFGTATVEDVESVASNLEIISKAVEKDRNVLKHMEEDMASFASKTAHSFEIK